MNNSKELSETIKILSLFPLFLTKFSAAKLARLNKNKLNNGWAGLHKIKGCIDTRWTYTLIKVLAYFGYSSFKQMLYVEGGLTTYFGSQ